MTGRWFSAGIQPEMCWTVSRSRRQLPSQEFCDLPEEEEKEGKILFIKNFWIRLYD